MRIRARRTVTPVRPMYRLFRLRAQSCCFCRALSTLSSWREFGTLESGVFGVCGAVCQNRLGIMVRVKMIRAPTVNVVHVVTILLERIWGHSEGREGVFQVLKEQREERTVFRLDGIGQWTGGMNKGDDIFREKDRHDGGLTPYGRFWNIRRRRLFVPDAFVILQPLEKPFAPP